MVNKDDYFRNCKIICQSYNEFSKIIFAGKSIKL